MKRIFINCLIGTALVIAGASAVQTQSKNSKPISEINLLRQKLVAAIKKGDRTTLENLYADDFTHTHATGQIDDKQTRIAALLSGGKTIESAETDEVKIRVYGTTTAVAVGQSTITDENQAAVKYRWTLVYAKTKNRWRIVASQATRLAEKQ